MLYMQQEQQQKNLPGTVPSLFILHSGIVQGSGTTSAAAV